jgi:hypothetical protein
MRNATPARALAATVFLKSPRTASAGVRDRGCQHEFALYLKKAITPAVNGFIGFPHALSCTDLNLARPPCRLRKPRGCGTDKYDPYYRLLHIRLNNIWRHSRPMPKPAWIFRSCCGQAAESRVLARRRRPRGRIDRDGQISPRRSETQRPALQESCKQASLSEYRGSSAGNKASFAVPLNKKCGVDRSRSYAARSGWE